MKKILVLALCLLGAMPGVEAATARRGGGATATAAKPAATSSASTARAARRTTAAPAAAASATTAARSAMPRNTAARSGTTTAAAPTVAARSATVSARAATKQTVIGSGTKVATAAKNVVVSEECQQKYEGCMDAFCMLDNETGGRCICSDKNAEYDSILAEIEKLDQQSYKMATAGVERIEMGADADAVTAAASDIAADIMSETEDEIKRTSSRKALDLSLWDTAIGMDEDVSVFDESSMMMSSVEGKEGDALHSAAAAICVAQIPECGSDVAMLRMAYAQKIRSDCAAYENSLKAQKKASSTKLAAAEKALRDAALDQYRSANKYDLGQCTIQFKSCMIKTGGCGEDFSKCASVAADDNTRAGVKAAKKYKIKGATSQIEISASTYDTLVAKKPLCESVTKNCVAVADQVWDTFLKEVAPQIKSAELIAEDNARQNCIGNISDCFHKACQDNIDPKDPDGSYDMCLTRPETMLNVCKIPLNACGIDTDPKKATESQIWGFVMARLASMRVDSCTAAVKECLTSEDRCGEDYTQCIGLDTDTIVRMCPYDKLVGCQQKYGEQEIMGEDVYDELARLVQGIFLNIDNNMLTQCQNAANEAMVSVCGDTANCNGLVTEENIGARSLEYKICMYKTNEDGSMEIDYNNCRNDVSMISDEELGRNPEGAIVPLSGVLDGIIYWENITFDEDGRVNTLDEYLSKLNNGTGKPVTDAERARIESELSVLQRNIDTAIDIIESNPNVQFCTTGREVQGMNRTISGEDGSSSTTRQTLSGEGRFPQLTKQMRMQIATAALHKAKENYYAKYDELNDKMLQDYTKLGERVAEIQGQNALDARREIARQACVNMAEAASMPKSPNPPKSAFGKIAAAVAIAAAVVAIPFTGGLSGAIALTATTSLSTAAVATGAVAAGAVGVATIGLAGNAGSGKANGADAEMQLDLVGSYSTNQWNYKETITSTFEWETLNCQRCTKSQQCAKTKNPVFGNKYCKEWEDAVETCTDIQF